MELEDELLLELELLDDENELEELERDEEEDETKPPCLTRWSITAKGQAAYKELI